MLTPDVEFGDPRLPERFWSKIRFGWAKEVGGWLVESECWLWTASLTPGSRGRLGGYAQYGISSGNMTAAHRYLYLTLIGPVPDGLQLDHRCHVRHCVRASHLEVVTPQVNVHRGIGPTARNAQVTHCPLGHEYEGTNVRVYNGGRLCRTCGKAAGHEFYMANRAHAIAAASLRRRIKAAVRDGAVGEADALRAELAERCAKQRAKIKAARAKAGYTPRRSWRNVDSAETPTQRQTPRVQKQNPR